MKRTQTIAIGVAAALSFGIAASAHAHPMGDMGPGRMGQMMQGHGTGGMQGGMGAGHQKPPAAAGSTEQHQHEAGAGTTAGGCPMMSMMTQHGHK